MVATTQKMTFFYLCRHKFVSLSRLLWLLLLLLPFSQTSSAASVMASLNKDVIVENEIVQLTIRTDFPETDSGPDLSVLKRDFEVLGQSQNSQFRFNLGTSQSLNFWVISLIPKSVGSISIPPIKVGQYQSNPLQLEVKTPPQLLDANGNAPVFLNVQVSEPQPYLQQQILITLQLYTSVALQNANISTPQHNNLVIERLVDDQVRTETRNGTAYQVLTREYLAFAQQSGILDIAPQTVTAMINTATGKRIVKVQSKPISLQVLAIPASYPYGNWLPVESATIDSQLSPTQDIRVGDTLKWTINIAAKGALPEQIPPMEFASTQDYKLYSQPAEFNSRKSQLGIEGQQTIVIEVVPTRAGKITLPALTLPYWDTEQRALHTATSEAISINVNPLPSVNGPISNSSLNKSPTSTGTEEQTTNLLAPQGGSIAPISLLKPEPKAPEKPASANSMAVNLTTTESSSFTWGIKQSLIGLLILISIIAGLLIWRKKTNRSATQPKSDEVPTLKDFAPLSTDNEQSAFLSLIQCCHDNDLSQLRGRLLEWGRHRWGEDKIHSIEDIKNLSQSQELTQLIMESELIMYSNQAAAAWNGLNLAEALEECITGQPKKSQSSQLKTLYPNF